jgi:transposase InsO family protein
MTLKQAGRAYIPCLDSKGKKHELVLTSFFDEKSPQQIISFKQLVSDGYSYTSTGALSQLFTTIYETSSQTEFAVTQKDSFLLSQPIHPDEPPLIVARIQVNENISSTERNQDEVLNYHHRFGHLNFYDLFALNKKYNLGIPFRTGCKYHCSTCAITKATRSKLQPKYSTSPPATRPNQRIFVDLKGPVKPKSTRGFEFILVIVDEFSRHVTVKMLKTKAEAAAHLKDYITQSAYPVHDICYVTPENSTDPSPSHYQTHSALPVGVLHSDNGGEFQSEDFLTFLKTYGVKKTFTTPYSPYSNGVVERMIRTLMETASSLLNHSGLSASMFWPDAIDTAAYIRNRLPATKTQIPPLERYAGVKVTAPMLMSLHSFGACAYATLPKQSSSAKERDSFDPKGIPTVYLGQSSNRRAAVLYDSKSGTIMESKDVQLVENLFPLTLDPKSTQLADSSMTITDPKAEILEETNREQDQSSELATTTPLFEESKRPLGPVPSPAPLPTHLSNDVSQYYHKDDGCFYCDVCGTYFYHSNGIVDHVKTKHPEVLKQRETFAETKLPTSSSPLSSNTPLSLPNSTVDSTTDPSAISSQRRSSRLAAKNYVTKLVQLEQSRSFTLKEALKGPYRKQFLEAMDKERKSQLDLGVGVEMKCSREQLRKAKKVVIPSIWILTLKITGEEKVFKARLVARGDLQRSGTFDPNKIYAPTVSSSSVRLLFAVATHLNRPIEHIDFSTAFLNADLAEEIYMTYPPNSGFPEDTVVLLKKSIYGLKQSPFNWNALLTAELLRLGYAPLIYDPCVFYNNKNGVMIGIHVDDVQIVAPSVKESEQLKASIRSLFKIKDLGKITNYLSFQVDYSDDKITLHQHDLIKELLSDLGLEDRKNVTSPAPSNSEKMDDKTPCPQTQYRSLVGRLSYLATHTRPDIALCLMLLSRKCEKPTMGNYNALLQIVLYLGSTPDYGISFRYNPPSSNSVVSVCAFTDATFASVDSTYAVTGGAVFVNGGPVHWIATKQDTIPQSSTEAELIAAHLLAREALYFASILDELNVPRSKPVMIFTDSKSLETLSINTATSSKSKLKYLRPKIQMLKDLIASGDIILKWISGSDNVADILTKPVSGSPFQYHANRLLNRD